MGKRTLKKVRTHSLEYNFLPTILPRSAKVCRSIQFKKEPPEWRVRGFTLLELIVTLAVSLTVAATALPALAKSAQISRAAVCASNIENWAYATGICALRGWGVHIDLAFKLQEDHIPRKFSSCAFASSLFTPQHLLS